MARADKNAMPHHQMIVLAVYVACVAIRALLPPPAPHDGRFLRLVRAEADTVSTRLEAHL